MGRSPRSRKIYYTIQYLKITMPQRNRTTQSKKKSGQVNKNNGLFSIAVLFFSALALMAIGSMDADSVKSNTKTKSKTKSKPKPKAKAKAKTSSRRPIINTE